MKKPKPNPFAKMGKMKGKMGEPPEGEDPEMKMASRKAKSFPPKKSVKKAMKGIKKGKKK